jgi:phosphohistidine phosphatase
MKTVTLFRHAKSGEKDNPNIEDFDRPLSDRGLKTAPKMGGAMRARSLRPNLILCSPSVRTRQTLSLAAAQAWDNPPKMRFEKQLYEASAQTVLKVLKDLPEDVAHVMIVGHNPGLQELAVALAPLGSEAREDLKEKLPTAAIASFDFDADIWKELKPASGQLRVFMAPGTLGQGQEK